MRYLIRPCVFFALVTLAFSPLLAGEPKPAPPKKVPIPEAAKAELESGLSELAQEIQALKTDLKDKPKLLDLLPDIQIYHNAVRYAIDDDLFYEDPKTQKIKELDTAKKLLAAGKDRAKALKAGQAPWTTQTGSVVRGYKSMVDGSAIPYGIVVPASFKAGDTTPHRLDFWLHGRDENLSELKFISGRFGGDFALENGFVLNVYGRLCNAYKFAGEIDALESLAHAQAHYPIDENRIAMRGFSMGGAGTWHLGAHYAGRWAAVNPGAGFVDVKNYQGLKANAAPWYEEKLWRLYDSLDYAIDLTNTTLVAYSGEIDAQKKAADLMEKALVSEGVKMTHIIGPNTGHKYEPKAKAEVAKLVDAAVAKGRDNVPHKIIFQTYTLKYNSMHWVTIDALDKQWERSRVTADIAVGDKSGFVVSTINIAAFTLVFDKSQYPFDARVSAVIDGAPIFLPAPNADKSLIVSFVKSNGKWELGKLPDSELRKRHNLQGPIDDAFVEPFLFVKPTGAPFSEKIGNWTKSEMDYAAKQWRRQLRGEAPIKADTDVTDADIAAHNLILWGDPSSNRILAKIAAKLPIKWTAQSIEVGAKNYPADQCAPVLIYPNPLNPARYVVINSGFTFAEFAAASNAQQTPKLPDWAVLDMKVPVTARLKEGVKDAGFFGEKWEYLEDRK